jgi:hypothetical protein
MNFENFVEYPEGKGFQRVEDTKWSDTHYDFTCKIPVTEADALLGHVSFKLDPYFVSHNWKLGSKDESGALWHIFKTCARFGVKNDIEREIKAIHGQVKRMAQIYNVDLEK